MKKLFYSLFLLPLCLLMSCDDDKDFSPVDMTLTLSGVTQYQGAFYTVSGDDVTINSLTVKAQDGKESLAQNVIFYLNGAPLLGTPANPFLGTFSTAGLQPGIYSLDVAGDLLQVGSSLQIFAVSFPLVIVESQENLPSEAPEIGTYSQVITLSNSK